MPEGTHNYEFHLGKQFFVNMESADIHDADLNVTLTVNHKSGYYNMDFAVDGTVTLICDRCLDNLVMPIETGYHIAVKYGDSYNDDSDDLLIIPESDNSLNVSYMIYDTVSLAIPIKHVHPLGKCNRAMSAMLKKHRATRVDDEDAALEEELMDEMDSMDTQTGGEGNIDPRWNELKNLTDNN